MAFSDLQTKVMAESAVIAAHRNLAKLGLFAKSFNELEDKFGASIAVPVYDLSASGDFVAGTNDYGTGSNEVGGVTVSLDKHLVKSVSITDRQLAETGINWGKDTATALADNLTRGVNAYVFGKINATDCPLSASFDATAKTVVANLYAIAENNDIPVDKAVVALTPTQYSKVLSMLDYCVLGSDESIKYSLIRSLYGFKGFICTSNLPEGNVGAIIMDEALGVASRWLMPQTPEAYPESGKWTTEDGFTIGYRRFMDLNTGVDKFAADVLVGAKVIQPNKIVRLV